MQKKAMSCPIHQMEIYEVRVENSDLYRLLMEIATGAVTPRRVEAGRLILRARREDIIPHLFHKAIPLWR